jgi:hypothetical protein
MAGWGRCASMSPNNAYGDAGRASVGSAAEEAARLVEAVRRWADDRGWSPNTGAYDSPDCRVCPICQLLSLFRQGQPEAYEHLGHAADSLLAAIRSGIAAHEAHWSRPGQPDVEHIDVD